MPTIMPEAVLAHANASKMVRGFQMVSMRPVSSIDALMTTMKMTQHASMLIEPRGNEMAAIIAS